MACKPRSALTDATLMMRAGLQAVSKGQGSVWGVAKLRPRSVIVVSLCHLLVVCAWQWSW